LESRLILQPPFLYSNQQHKRIPYPLIKLTLLPGHGQKHHISMVISCRHWKGIAQH
jgi:hypothetical protein